MQIFNALLNLCMLALWGYVILLRKQQEKQRSLLAELESFLEQLASAYVRCGDMRDALDDCTQACSGTLLKELQGLQEALTPEASADDFCRSSQNTYLLLLYSLCDTVRVFGDMQHEGMSLFVQNIRYIKEEVRLELLRRQEGHYAFLGLSALSVVPFFLCEPVRLWSASVSTSLVRFSVGSYGFVTLMVCFFLGAGCLWCVQELQFPRPPAVSLLDRCSERLLRLPLLGRLIDRQISAHYSYYLRKNEQLKVLQGFGNIREFLVKKLVCAGVASLSAVLLFAGGQLAGGAQGQTDVFVPAVVVLSAAAMLLGWMLPELRAAILQTRVAQQKMEETLRFQTVILLVMHYSRITVEEILQWMERFSFVFSRALQRAVDDYSYRRRESLEQLKEDLAYEPADALADALLVCDDLSVEQAFFDLSGSRAYNMEQFRRKISDLQREKAAFARVIAFLPFVAVLTLRLVIPFVLEGLTQLNGYA